MGVNSRESILAERVEDVVVEVPHLVLLPDLVVDVLSPAIHQDGYTLCDGVESLPCGGCVFTLVGCYILQNPAFRGYDAI